MNRVTFKIQVECPTCAGDGCYLPGTGWGARQVEGCDDGLVTVELPGKYEVCQTCGGHGSHVDRNVDGNGITASEWAEWDEDDRETYMSGGYDVTCEECNGARVVAVADVERLDHAQLVQLQQHEKREAEAHRANYEDAYTRRMESGGGW